MNVLREHLRIVPERRPAEVERMHFVGIGGTGMCGIAEILLTLGYQISGSDIRISRAVKRLIGLGAQISIGHASSAVKGADVVVRSAAIPADNPEVLTAEECGIPVVDRIDVLASLMRLRRGIAISGTHGKTTVTGMTAHLLHSAGLDPTYIVGGRVLSSAANGVLGHGEYLVAEADESDGSILRLQPDIGVITNIDDDHLEHYDGDISKLEESFLQFTHLVPVFGHIVYCAEDPHLRKIAPRMERRQIKYGFSRDCDYRASDIAYLDNAQMSFRLHAGAQEASYLVRLGVPGKHNVLNALAAVAVAHSEGADIQVLVEALEKYKGVARRLEVKGQVSLVNKHLTVISDYGHHPTELRATLEAVRGAWPDHGLCMIFQPHRYSRTQRLFGSFARELAKVDRLILLPTYAAGEKALPGADSHTLGSAIAEISGRSPRIASRDDWREVLAEVALDGDLLLMQGAGDVGLLANELVEIGE